MPTAGKLHFMQRNLKHSVSIENFRLLCLLSANVGPVYEWWHHILLPTFQLFHLHHWSQLSCGPVL